MVQVAKLEKRRRERQQGQGVDIPIVDSVRQYRSWIGWGIVGVAVIIGGIWYYQNAQQQQNQKALTALSRILPYFERGEYQKALEGDPSRRIRGEQVIGLKSIVEEYSGTAGARIAALFAAHALASQGKFSEAATYYDIARGSSSLDVQLGGLGGSGAVADAAFQYTEGAENWHTVAQKGKERSEYQRYLLYSAQLYEVAGQKEEAAKLYREIVLTSPFSYYAGFAKSGLVRVGEDIVPVSGETTK